MALPAENEQLGKVLPWRQRAGAMVGQQRPNGAITGKAQVLDDAILDLHLPGRAQDFLRMLTKGTYHKGGFHIQDGTPEHWCEFNLATWAERLKMKKPNLCRMRDYLLALHIIQIQVDNDGTVFIGWNLNTTEWQAPPKHGGSREGAGRPKNQDDNAPEIIQDDNKTFQDDNDTHFKMITMRGDEGRPGAASEGVLRNVSKKLTRNDLPDANASSGAPANANAPQTVSTPKKKKLEPKDEAPSEDDPAYKVALYLRQAVMRYAPDARLPTATPKGLATWVKDTRMMLDTHKRAPPDIKLVIDFVVSEPFWQPHILSARKLKEKFDTLLVQAKRGNINGQQHRPISAHAQTTRRGQPLASTQRQSRPGDDD